MIDPPNAVLVVDDKKIQDFEIVELFNPVYDSDEKTLTYNMTPVNSISLKLLSEAFGESTLIIDNVKCSSPWDPRGC